MESCLTPMTSELSTVFVTGAASGIGRATALTFARHGYRVGAYDIDLGGLASLRDEITSDGGDAVIGELYVTDVDQWSAQMEAFTGESRRLDILVNNAGVLSSGPFEDIPLVAHRRMIDINFYGALTGLHTALPYLRDTAHSQVVNMCSASAIYGQPELATYSATKFALRALTEALELEWRRHGIRVLSMWRRRRDPHDRRDAGRQHQNARRASESRRRRQGGLRGHPSSSQLAAEGALPGRPETNVFAAVSQVTPNWVQRLITKTVTRS